VTEPLDQLAAVSGDARSTTVAASRRNPSACSSPTSSTQLEKPDSSVNSSVTSIESSPRPNHWEIVSQA
jgi:hypothetical protein